MPHFTCDIKEEAAYWHTVHADSEEQARELIVEAYGKNEGALLPGGELLGSWLDITFHDEEELPNAAEAAYAEIEEIRPGAWRSD